MQVLVAGLNHKTSPLGLLERTAFTRSGLPEAIGILRDRVGQAVVLSTCNRTEIYTICEQADTTADEIRLFLADFHDLDVEELAAHTYQRTDLDAVRHLFRVTSGLDSMILGESQILGQVRSALTLAADAKAVQVPLSRVFHGAIRTGRRVREETDLGRNALSVSFAAVRLAQRVLGTLQGARVLLVGAGEAGKLVARALHMSGVSEIVVANRTLERGEEVARPLQGRAVGFDDISSIVREADIVVTATEAPGYVISSELLASVAQERVDRPLFVFDLGVPRNVDPDGGSLDGVTLFNIEDLSTVAEENVAKRAEAAVEAEKIVEHEVSRFSEWWGSREAVSIVKALQGRGEEIRSRELDRALRRMGDLSPEQREVVEALTRSIVRKLLHDPTRALKGKAARGRLQAVRDLFGLSNDEES